MDKGKKSPRAGKFTIAPGKDVYGELTISRAKTSLYLHDKDFFDTHSIPDQYIKGILHDLTRISLIRCITTSTGSSIRGQESYHSSTLFPHFVVSGDNHLAPDQKTIVEVHFSVDDASTLFYDFDAFGSLIDARPFIETIVNAKANALQRKIAIGANPEILYFTGKGGNIRRRHRARKGLRLAQSRPHSGRSQWRVPEEHHPRHHSAYSERWRSAFRGDGDHDSELMPIAIPRGWRSPCRRDADHFSAVLGMVIGIVGIVLLSRLHEARWANMRQTASIPFRWRLVNSVRKYSSSVSFLRSCPNHNGSAVSRLHTTVRNLSRFPWYSSSTPMCRNGGFRRLASQRSKYRRSMPRTVLSARPIRRATCRAAALSQDCPTASSNRLL